MTVEAAMHALAEPVICPQASQFGNSSLFLLNKARGLQGTPVKCSVSTMPDLVRSISYEYHMMARMHHCSRTGTTLYSYGH